MGRNGMEPMRMEWFFEILEKHWWKNWDQYYKNFGFNELNEPWMIILIVWWWVKRYRMEWDLIF